jgi:hypothetical protein
VRREWDGETDRAETPGVKGGERRATAERSLAPAPAAQGVVTFVTLGNPSCGPVPPGTPAPTLGLFPDPAPATPPPSLVSPLLTGWTAAALPTALPFDAMGALMSPRLHETMLLANATCTPGQMDGQARLA